MLYFLSPQVHFITPTQRLHFLRLRLYFLSVALSEYTLCDGSRASLHAYLPSGTAQLDLSPRDKHPHDPSHPGHPYCLQHARRQRQQAHPQEDLHVQTVWQDLQQLRQLLTTPKSPYRSVLLVFPVLGILTDPCLHIHSL